MRHAKLFAAVIISVSTLGLAQARDQAIIIGEPAMEAAPVTPAKAVAGEIPGGITDGAWKTAFVIGENGHTEAVDLKTGVTKFASATPAIPLALANETLYVLTRKVDPTAQKAEVVVRGMSVSSQGKYTFESKKIPVPEWLTTSRGSSMTATAKIEGGKMILAWQANMDAYSAGDGQNLQFRAINMAIALQQQAQQGAFANGPAAMDQANQAMTFTEIDLKTGDIKVTDKKPEAAAGQEQPALQQEVDLVEADNDGPVPFNGPVPTQPVNAPSVLSVMRDGNIYSVAAKSGEAQMNCRRIEDQRLLWIHPISPSRVLKTDMMAPEKPPVMPMNNRRFIGCGLQALERC